MKILTYFSILGFIFIFFLQKVTPIVALQNYETGATLLSNNFNSSFTGWVPENNSSSWSINNGNLLGYSTYRSAGSHITYSGGNWDNFSLEVDIRNNGGVDEGVTFRRADVNNTYELNLRHGTGTYNTPEIKLFKYQGGVVTTLQSIHSVPLANNQWYHLKIEAYQEHIQVWLDSSLVFEVDDPGTTVTSGPVGFSYWTGDYGISIVRFDNFTLKSITLITPTPTPTSTSTPTPTSLSPTLTPGATTTPTPSPTLTPTPTPETSLISDPTPIVLEPTSTPTPSPTLTMVKLNPTVIPTPTSNKLKLELLSIFWPTPTPKEISSNPEAAVLGLSTTGNFGNLKQDNSRLFLFLTVGVIALTLQGVFVITRVRKFKANKRH